MFSFFRGRERDIGGREKGRERDWGGRERERENHREGEGETGVRQR